MSGSLMNDIMGMSVSLVKPDIGMGVTKLCYSDRHACTVVKVEKNGKTVVVQQDHAERLDKNGMSENQHYRFSPDREGTIWVFTLRKNGIYVEEGSRMNSGNRLFLVCRNEYHDFSF